MLLSPFLTLLPRNDASYMKDRLAILAVIQQVLLDLNPLLTIILSRFYIV
jgi:hypothetical protein